MSADGAADGAGLALRALDGGGDDLEARFAADTWHADELGVAAARGRETVSFGGISPSWLRSAVKTWSRQRIALNYAFNTVRAAALALRRFSAFLASCQPPAERPEEVDRALIEAYLAWLAPAPALAVDQGAFPGVPAALPGGEPPLPLGPSHPPRRRRVPRRGRLPAHVAAPVRPRVRHGPGESEANLARLRPHYQHLVVVLTETGLRAGDACTLRSDALLADSSGWPCLRFQAHKMRAEQLVPLSEKAVGAIRDQQRQVEGAWPAGSPWLFPARSDPTLAQGYDAFRGAFTRWQERIRAPRRGRATGPRGPSPAPPQPGHTADQQGCPPARDTAPAGTRQP